MSTLPRVSRLNGHVHVPRLSLQVSSTNAIVQGFRTTASGFDRFLPVSMVVLLPAMWDITGNPSAINSMLAYPE